MAPADVHIVVAGKGDEVVAKAEQLAAEAEAAGVRVLIDDRTGVSAGVKFNDADLLGIPTIMIVGKALADGLVEFKDRRSGERRTVPVDDVVTELVAGAR